MAKDGKPSNYFVICREFWLEMVYPPLCEDCNSYDAIFSDVFFIDALTQSNFPFACLTEGITPYVDIPLFPAKPGICFFIILRFYGFACGPQIPSLFFVFFESKWRYLRVIPTHALRQQKVLVTVS